MMTQNKMNTQTQSSRCLFKIQLSNQSITAPLSNTTQLMIFWKNWFLRTLYLWCVREAPKGYSSHQLEFAACSGPKWEGKWENNLLHCQTNGDNRALFPAPKFIKPSDYRMNDRTSSIILAFAWKLRSAMNMF